MHPLSMMGSNYHSMDLCLSPLLPGHCHFLSLLRQAMRLFLVWDSEGISEVTDTIVEDLFSAADTDDSSDDDDNGGGEGGGGHGRGRAVAKRSKKDKKRKKQSSSGSPDSDESGSSSAKAKAQQLYSYIN